MCAIKNISLMGLISFSILLNGCKERHDPASIYTVKLASVPHTLTYKSYIAPLEVFNVQSPADGVINKVNVPFGAVAEKSAVLLSLASPKYILDYQNAMLSYLKAKEDYTNTKNSFNGTEELWHHGLIAKEDYESKKSSLANSYAVLLQQQDALKKFLAPGMQIDPNWSLENQKKLQTLFGNVSDLVNIYAPISGIVMGPAKSSNSNAGGDNQITKLTPGIFVHQGDSLLTIANLSGFNLQMSVSEMDVDNIRANMPASITSDVFSDVLQGYVSYVSIQAKSTSNESVLPEFPIEVIVPHVDPKLLKKIRLGMSVKVSIDLGSPQQLLIPLNAIGDEHGQDVVKKLDKKGRLRITPIKTGDATIDQVAVLSGLSQGDQILVPY